MPQDPDPLNGWLLLGRPLIAVAPALCLFAITLALQRRARRPATTFHIMLVHWLLWGPVIAFGWSLQFVIIASPSQRMGAAPVVIWAVGSGLGLICLGLGLGLGLGAVVEDMPLLEVCIHTPEAVTFRSVRGRAYRTIGSVSLGLGMLVYAAVLALAGML